MTSMKSRNSKALGELSEPGKLSELGELGESHEPEEQAPLAGPDPREACGPTEGLGQPPER